MFSQTENIFHLFRPGLIMTFPGGKFARLLAPENRRVNIASYLSVYYLTYDIFCHYRLKCKKIRVEILWRTVSLLPVLSKTMLMALVIILMLPKSCGCACRIHRIRVDGSRTPKEKMRIKKYPDTSRRGLICFQKYKILTEAQLLKNCGQFKIFPEITENLIQSFVELPYLGALSIQCQNWPARPFPSNWEFYF